MQGPFGTGARKSHPSAVTDSDLLVLLCRLTLACKARSSSRRGFLSAAAEQSSAGRHRLQLCPGLVGVQTRVSLQSPPDPGERLRVKGLSTQCSARSFMQRGSGEPRGSCGLAGLWFKLCQPMLKVKSWHFPTNRVDPQSPGPAVAHGSPTQYIASNCQGCAELRDGVPPPWLCSGTAVSHPTQCPSAV